MGVVPCYPQAMPYPGGQSQCTAVFLSIKRKSGEAAAKKWYEKHRSECQGQGHKQAAARSHGRSTAKG